VKNETKAVIKVYPNPSTDMINFSEELNHVQIVNLEGKNILNQESATSIKVSALSPGQYFVIARNNQGKTVHLQFVKN
jgi:sarcosine oxidase gamma subunit